MSLGIYRESGKSGLISTGGAMTSPILVEGTQDGAVVERRLFLAMTDPTESASDIVVSSEDLTSPDESGWVEFSLESGGVANSYSSSINIASLPVGQELPFWIRVTIPQAEPLGFKDDITIKTEYVLITA